MTDAGLFPTQKAAFMDALASLEPGETADLTVHQPGCRVEEIDLCTCEPTVYHHGHEPEGCQP